MKKIVILGTVLVVLGVVITLGRGPYQKWEQKHFITQAVDYFNKRDYGNSVSSAQKALKVNPGNVEACQIMAIVAEQLRSSDALRWRRRIVELQPNSITNRLTLARAALQLGDVKEADQALRGVKEADRNRADYHELVALLDLANKDTTDAEVQAAYAAKLDPQNQSLQFNLAVLDLQSKTPRLVAAGKKGLLALLAEPAFRQRALRELAEAAMRDSDFTTAEAYGKQLLLEDPPVLEDEVFCLEILKADKSPQFSVSLANIETQVATHSEFIRPLADWLIDHHMTDEALRWMLDFPTPTQKQQPVPLAIADCFIAGHYWARMQSFLSNDDWGDLEFMRLALLARALREQRNELAAQANWHAALTAAEGHEQSLAALTRMAASWRWDNEEVEAAWQAVDRFPAQTWALKLLDLHYQERRDARGMQKVYAERLKNDKSDLANNNNFAALSMLLGLQLPDAYRIAGADFQRAPQDPFVASTYAYSLYRQGRAQEALSVMDKVPKDALVQPSMAVYYGVMLTGAGQPVKARDYLAIAAKGATRLLPEEQALLASVRGSSPVRVK